MNMYSQIMNESPLRGQGILSSPFEFIDRVCIFSLESQSQPPLRSQRLRPKASESSKRQRKKERETVGSRTIEAGAQLRIEVVIVKGKGPRYGKAHLTAGAQGLGKSRKKLISGLWEGAALFRLHPENEGSPNLPQIAHLKTHSNFNFLLPTINP